jgi:hypothetical protein
MCFWPLAFCHFSLCVALVKAQYRTFVTVDYPSLVEVIDRTQYLSRVEQRVLGLSSNRCNLIITAPFKEFRS